MPLTTTEIYDEKKEMLLNFRGKEFKVWANPARYTGNLIANSMSMPVYEYLTILLVDWEVEYGKKDPAAPEGFAGKRVPIEDAHLKNLPLSFLQFVNREVTNQILPNPITPEG